MAANAQLAFSIYGPIERSDLPGLCERVCVLLQRSGPGVVLCDVAGVEPSGVTIEALARLQLAAVRRGCRVRLLDPSAALRELVELMGLSEVVVS